MKEKKEMKPDVVGDDVIGLQRGERSHGGRIEMNGRIDGEERGGGVTKKTRGSWAFHGGAQGLAGT